MVDARMECPGNPSPCMAALDDRLGWRLLRA